MIGWDTKYLLHIMIYDILYLHSYLFQLLSRRFVISFRLFEVEYYWKEPILIGIKVMKNVKPIVLLIADSRSKWIRASFFNNDTIAVTTKLMIIIASKISIRLLNIKSINNSKKWWNTWYTSVRISDI